jgi:small basic protein (TIGR04137 family)
MEPEHDQRSRQNEARADLKPFAFADLASTFCGSNQERFMSQHRSLKGASTIQTKRNVLKRFERVELLKKRGLFKPGDRVIGLPKTKPDL